MDPISEESRNAIDTCEDIIAVGKKTGVDLLAYYAASDCFVFPSYREGFPNTVIEAGAMGLPSIVTDINGAREIIINGENGVIVPSKDADALHDAMLKMLEDKAERERMAGNARHLIETRYEQRFVRQCLYDFYKEVLPTNDN
jgi:glycosyltransferase involved in cell wall biosynthesis